MDHQYSN